MSLLSSGTTGATAGGLQKEKEIRDQDVEEEIKEKRKTNNSLEHCCTMKKNTATDTDCL